MEKMCSTCVHSGRQGHDCSYCDANHSYWQPKTASTSTVLTDVCGDCTNITIHKTKRQPCWPETCPKARETKECFEAQDAHTRHQIAEWLEKWWINYGCEPPSHDSVMAFNQILTELKK